MMYFQWWSVAWHWSRFMYWCIDKIIQISALASHIVLFDSSTECSVITFRDFFVVLLKKKLSRIESLLATVSEMIYFFWTPLGVGCYWHKKLEPCDKFFSVKQKKKMNSLLKCSNTSRQVKTSCVWIHILQHAHVISSVFYQ